MASGQRSSRTKASLSKNEVNPSARFERFNWSRRLIPILIGTSVGVLTGSATAQLYEIDIPGAFVGGSFGFAIGIGVGLFLEQATNRFYKRLLPIYLFIVAAIISLVMLIAR
jgi:hypothetical protein